MRRSRAPSQTAKRQKTKPVSVTIAKKPTFQQVSRVPRMGLGFPKMLQAKLKYVDYATLSSSAAQNAIWVFSCNGMFKPNTSASGHQPMYFDQYMTMYDHYTVLSSFIRVTFIPNTQELMCTVTVDDDSSPAGTAGTVLAERSPSTNLVINSQSSPVSITKSWDGKKMFGGDLLDNDNLQGTSAANPSEISSFIVSLNSPTAAAITATEIYVEIWYTAQFDELISIGQS